MIPGVLDCQSYSGIQGYSDKGVLERYGSPGMIPGLPVILRHTGIL